MIPGDVSGACLQCGAALGPAHACLDEHNGPSLPCLPSPPRQVPLQHSVLHYLIFINHPEWAAGAAATVRARLKACHIPPDAPYAEWADVVSRASYPVGEGL